MNVRKVLIFTSLLEIAVGLALMHLPSVVIHLLFGIDVSDNEKVLGRFAGIVLVCFGFACLPGRVNVEDKNIKQSVQTMFTYNFLVAIYFSYLKFANGFDGILLLPTIILHAVIAIYFGLRVFGFKY